MSEILQIIVALLIAITFHEASHALAAYLSGDPTAKQLGRLSLNPLVHLDPVGTLMMVFTALAGFGIGWGKPVPVNAANLRLGPRVGMAPVAIAGPLANFAVAFLASLPFRLHAPISVTLGYALLIIIVVNIALALFNLIPIPPLDGSNVLIGLVPSLPEAVIVKYFQYGPPTLLTLILLDQWFRLGLLSSVLIPATRFTEALFLGG
ncbi:MAG: site-2 protease family protein [Chloroflexi bacterium]|nr:site-2 protease family protein [Chloroflexota bacterium]